MKQVIVIFVIGLSLLAGSCSAKNTTTQESSTTQSENVEVTTTVSDGTTNNPTTTIANAEPTTTTTTTTEPENIQKTERDIDVVPLPGLEAGTEYLFENFSGPKNAQVLPDGSIVFTTGIPGATLLGTIDASGSYTTQPTSFNTKLLAGGKNFAFTTDEPNGTHWHDVIISPTFNQPWPDPWTGMNAHYENGTTGQVLGGWEMDLVIPEWFYDSMVPYQQITHVAADGTITELADFPSNFTPDNVFAATDGNETWVSVGRDGGAPAAGGEDSIVIGHGSEIALHAETFYSDYEQPIALATNGTDIIGISPTTDETGWAGIRYNLQGDYLEPYEFIGFPETGHYQGAEIPYLTDTRPQGLFYTQGLWVMPLSFARNTTVGEDRVEFWISQDGEHWELYETKPITDQVDPRMVIDVWGGRILVFFIYEYAPGETLWSLTKLTIYDLP